MTTNACATFLICIIHYSAFTEQSALCLRIALHYCARCLGEVTTGVRDLLLYQPFRLIISSSLYSLHSCSIALVLYRSGRLTLPCSRKICIKKVIYFYVKIHQNKIEVKVISITRLRATYFRLGYVILAVRYTREVVCQVPHLERRQLLRLMKKSILGVEWSQTPSGRHKKKPFTLK